METHPSKGFGEPATALVLDPAHADALALLGEAFLGAGQPEAGLRAFRRAAAAAPERPELHHILGCLLRDTGDRAGAAAAFLNAAERGHGWGLPRLYFWRLLSDAGQIGNAIPFGDALAADCPDYAEEVLSDIALFQVRRQGWAEALDAYRRLAAVKPEIRAMLGDALADGGQPADATERPQPELEGMPDALPPMAGRFAAAYEAGGWQEHRILVLMPKHVQCNPYGLDHDLGRYMTEAAAASGLEALFVAADDISYPSHMTPERRAASAANLRSVAAQIRSFRPDIVMIDCNDRSDGDTIRQEWLRELQAEVPFRVVGLVPDNYDGGARIAHWRPAVDAFVHFEPRSGDGGSLILSYVPVPDWFRSGAARDLPGIFIGSATSGGLGHRALWLAALKTLIPDCLTLLGSRMAGTSPDLRDYAALHGRARFSVNFGRRASGQVIVTGRTYESIKAGCLLLEQAGSGLDCFFVEGGHFLTFRDAGEMVALGRRILAEDERRATMAADAQAFLDTHYAARFFWPYIIARLKS